jgi:3-oxoacyl-[acyl-carrier-protein] synthase-1
MKWPGSRPSLAGKDQPTPRRLPEPDAPAPALHISALGLCCLAGDQPFALLGAVATSLCGARPSTSLTAAGVGPDDESPILRAPISGFEGIDHPGERITLLAAAALGQSLSGLPEGTTWSRILVLTLLPPAESPRGQALGTPDLERALRDLHPGLLQASFRFVAAAEGAVAHLREVGLALAGGRWEAVLFGGADSLVDAVTCGALIGEGRILTAAGAAGILPGEGAAYLLLRGGEAGPPGRGRIAGAGHASEPHPAAADRCAMTGLPAAIEEALASARAEAAAVGAVVLPFGAETSGALEWHQVRQRLWPNISTPVDRAEELLPGLVLGELGAAAFPVALALGWARLDFGYPPAGTVLVCEAGDQMPRGAVLLSS